MNPIIRIPSTLAVVVCFLGVSLSFLEAGIQEQANEGVRLMKERKWDEALKIHEQIVQEHGEGAMEAHGPAFGQIYFRKGYCELKLKKWEQAVESFKVCHVDFGNREDVKIVNEFESRSLLLWSQAAMGMEDWDLALELLDQFIQSPEFRRASVPKGDVLLAKASCQLRLGKIEEGRDLFQAVLDAR